MTMLEFSSNMFLIGHLISLTCLIGNNFKATRMYFLGISVMGLGLSFLIGCVLCDVVLGY